MKGEIFKFNAGLRESVDQMCDNTLTIMYRRSNNAVL